MKVSFTMEYKDKDDNTVKATIEKLIICETSKEAFIEAIKTTMGLPTSIREDEKAMSWQEWEILNED